MFDTEGPGSIFASASPPADVAASPGEPPQVPLERLEAQICELAGHLAAATCRFLVLLGDFDARRGWASWEMNSCAQWLSWKCQMSSVAAREHVRVARALRDLPVIRREFGAGRLSYVKVRALTRIATPETEAGLAEIAGPMTGNQLERFARAHRRVSQADDATARVRRRLVWRFEEDGSLSGSFRLPPLAGAVLLKALRAACIDREPAPGSADAGVSAETLLPPGPEPPDASAPEPAAPADPPAPATIQPAVHTSSTLADALVAVAESFLAGKVAGAEDAEVYQVIVHVGADTLTARPGGNVSAETSAPALDDPADPARCHVEDGPAVSISTAQMLTCTAALSWMRHGPGGAVLALGRRRRRPNAAQRRAARDRDQGRCRFPGCTSRRTDLHHIRYWSNGGRTDLDNLISLCKHHHTLVHERGYLIAASAAPGRTFAFYRPDGTALPASPALPPPDATIDDAHDADITAETIIPPWYGERLDLDHAIYVCFANARTARDKQQHPAGPPGRRGGARVYEPEECGELARQYLEHAPRRTAPILIPIQV